MAPQLLHLSIETSSLPILLKQQLMPLQQRPSMLQMAPSLQWPMPLKQPILVVVLASLLILSMKVVSLVVEMDLVL